MLELVRLLLTAPVGRLRDRQDLVLENVLLRHQLAVALRHQLAVTLRSGPRPKPRASDKLLWVLARRFCPRWRHHLVLVTPDTVIRWP
jgi:hypothetical protein